MTYSNNRQRFQYFPKHLLKQHLSSNDTKYLYSVMLGTPISISKIQNLAFDYAFLSCQLQQSPVN